MKKFFLSALFAVTLATAAYSSDENKINVRILNNFRAEFGKPNDVEWSLKSDFASASFMYNNENLKAFFDLNGQLIGTSKAVTVDQMPVNVKRVFAKRYSDYTIKETIRFDGSDESSYYISAENDNRSIVLKVSVTGTVSLYQAASKKK